MQAFYFLVALLASAIGAISGIGGGVIIKPVLDAVSDMSLSQINLLSSFAVLSMSVLSLLRNGRSKGGSHRRKAFMLAAGASCGGLFGKALFSTMDNALSDPSVGFIIQNLCLILINTAVLVYMYNKGKIRPVNLTNPALTVMAGLVLGLISSFLGIGGGPINIAVINLLFSMPPKKTVLCSLFIVMLSQVTGLLTLTVTGFPQTDIITLVLMCLGGIAGALIGGSIAKIIKEQTVAMVFTSLTYLLITLNILNLVKYLA